MDLGIAGRSAVVTGASRGLGRAIAEALAAEGAKVTLVARGAETLEQTAAAIRATGASVHALSADVTSAADCERIVAEAVAAHGGLDILVNNAGGGGAADDLEARWRVAYELNVVSVVRLMELAHPHLAASGQGAVVNISSIYGRESGGPPQYNANKAAQIGLTKAYALDWAKQGIRVNSLAPGSIAFEGGSWGRRVREQPEAMEQFVAQNIAAGRFGRAEEIGAVVAFLCSPRASWVIGATLNVDGGQSRSNI
ncbi:MAG: SDR family NAD(P)-dependent oxidoreductase [Dehalococcoidia bacterium]